MKNILKMMIMMLLVGLLSGCNAVIADKKEDYSNKTLTGMISEINGTVLTLELGKLKKSKQSKTENDQIPQMSEGQIPQEFNGEKPELPEDFDGQLPENNQGQMMHGPGQMGGSEERPQKPEGFNGEMPEDFNGEKPEDMNGERPQLPEDFDGQFPEDFSGQLPEDFKEQMNEGGNSEFMQKPEKSSSTTVYTFKKKSETATIDLKNVTVTLADGSSGTISDLNIGDVVQIKVDENNNASSVIVYQVETVEE